MILQVETTYKFSKILVGLFKIGRFGVLSFVSGSTTVIFKYSCMYSMYTMISVRKVIVQ